MLIVSKAEALDKKGNLKKDYKMSEMKNSGRAVYFSLTKKRGPTKKKKIKEVVEVVE